MRPFRGWMLVLVLMMVGAVALAAGRDDDDDQSPWSTDELDDAWVERVLSDPTYDRGWTQNCSHQWGDRRVAHCEVREFKYTLASSQPIAINGGNNGGMTVMAWDRDEVRVIYRVQARARTEERARALAGEIQLELAKGWLRPDGPDLTDNEYWSVEVKAWVPRESDLMLRTHNGPLGVRGVKGTMALRTLNGPMSLVDLAGAVEAHTTNGPLHVALAGSKWDGAGLDAAAVNGPLNFILPSNYSARIQTGTIHGPRSINYALGTGRTSGHFTRTVGSGGAPVRVVTDNGPFHMAYRSRANGGD